MEAPCSITLDADSISAGALSQVKSFMKKRFLSKCVLLITRAKSSYDTCDEARRAKSQDLIWHEL